MQTLIEKLVLGLKVDNRMIYDELYEICDSVHSSCDDSCPVYRLNGSAVPDTAKDFEANRGCDCFKNGKAMAEFIKNNS
jgi:hypothetical protein